jgi:hypothetical protein
MPASNETDFDVEKFRKTVAMFDSSNAGESGNAIRAALRQCEKADIYFAAALEMAYGGGNAGVDRARIAELESQAEALAAKVLEFQTANDELRNEIDRLNAEREYPTEPPPFRDPPRRNVENEKPARSAFKWPSLAWSWPNALTLALGFVIALSWIWVEFSDNYSSMLLLYAARWVLFLAWGIVAFHMEGVRVLLVKAALWVMGWCVVALVVVNALTPGLSEHAKRWLFVPWLWVTPVNHFDRHKFLALLVALLLLAGIVAANLSTFSGWLVQREKENA